MSWLDTPYDYNTWLEASDRWPVGKWAGAEEWAADMAEAWWGDFPADPGETGVELLTRTLVACARDFPKAHPGCRVLLHLPDPREMPLPVYVTDRRAQGESSAALRAFVLADDPEAVEPPIVEDFAVPAGVGGLRSLRYATVPGSADLMVGLRYAWRSVEHGRDVVVLTASPAPGRVLAALEDIDELVRGFRVRHDDDDPEIEDDD
ncbi:hypothetical protein [Streptomyces sp. H39-S7]|uniref:hypothetical protein n=1 Tax=Streptomyces sp. H39-S7 TaxID=3004357 RepID=UPI0022AF71A0|nr:hypothetical protein [Streptomyces sp. H39-S7]MCZ4118592.1 hypothetical protein [Streptomyces sp. H39-S7]